MRFYDVSGSLSGRGGAGDEAGGPAELQTIATGGAINVEHISDNIQIGEKARAHCTKSEGTCEEIIFVDPKEHSFKLTTTIHGNRVSFASYNPKDLTGIVIENQFIADHMREIYKILEEYFKGKH